MYNHSSHILPAVSVLTDLAYGILFGIFSALISSQCGVNRLRLNWDIMVVGPVRGGHIFNWYYGSVYDNHIHIGEGVLSDGLAGLLVIKELTLSPSCRVLRGACWPCGVPKGTGRCKRCIRTQVHLGDVESGHSTMQSFC